jgi:Uma2 family endonuclease
MPGSDEMKPAGVRLTYDDFLLFPDDGMRHELIDGEHYVTPSPNTKHQTVSMTLAVLIGGWLERNPIGRIYHAPFDVVFSRFDVVEPDLPYLSNDRAADVLTPQHVRGAPDLSSRSARQARIARDETKRALYERMGVTECWFVDPEIDVVGVYGRSANGSLARWSSRETNDVLTTSLLPGLELPLARLFRV